MGLQGRHRRYRPSRVNRASLTVTAGGAGLALPLLGAGTAAQAASPQVRELPQQPLTTPPAAGSARTLAGTVPAAQGAPTAAPRTYTVAGGDTLSRIAQSQKVEGGWRGLYDANRKIVGSDPNMIVPGQRLSLVVEHRPAAGTAKAEEKAGDRAEAGPQDAPEGGSRPDPAEKESEPGAEREEKPRAEEKGEKEAGAGKARADDSTRASRTGSTGPRLTAPVPAGPSTPYRAAGGSWSSGYHTGVDFPVPTGTPVSAVAAGHVVSAGWADAYGYEVVIRHADGRYSQYAHLSALTVRGGQKVDAGRRIGRSGSTGNSTGPHLHFEVRSGPGYGSDVDPLAYLRAGGVRI